MADEVNTKTKKLVRTFVFDTAHILAELNRTEWQSSNNKIFWWVTQRWKSFQCGFKLLDSSWWIITRKLQTHRGRYVMCKCWDVDRINSKIVGVDRLLTWNPFNRISSSPTRRPAAKAGEFLKTIVKKTPCIGKILSKKEALRQNGSEIYQTQCYVNHDRG